MALRLAKASYSAVKFFIFFGLFVSLLSCASNKGSAEKSQPAPRYHANSWKSMIDANCVVYFDGCNQCRRSPGQEAAACTKLACFAYSKPECYQTSLEKNEIQNNTYQCDEGVLLEFYRGRYNVGDLRKTLADNQIMLRDPNKNLIYELRRVSSGSGEKYSDGITVFWLKDNLAQVQLAKASPWLSCSIK